MQTFRLTNTKTGEFVNIDARDGIEAFWELKERCPEQWSKGIQGIENFWNIGLYCLRCGKYSGTHTYCSRTCFEVVLH